MILALNYLQNNAAGKDLALAANAVLSNHHVSLYVKWVQEAIASSCADPDQTWGFMKLHHWFETPTANAVHDGHPSIFTQVTRLLQRTGWNTGIEFDHYYTFAPERECSQIVNYSPT